MALILTLCCCPELFSWTKLLSVFYFYQKQTRQETRHPSGNACLYFFTDKPNHAVPQSFAGLFPSIDWKSAFLNKRLHSLLIHRAA